jgi:hypothetical protein
VTAAESPRLGTVGVAALESLYQHRLLSTRQLHELHMPNRQLRSMQRILARLRSAGLALSTREPGGLGLWFLSAAGIEAMEAIPSRAEPRSKLIPPAQAAGPLQSHTLAVNDVGIAFVRAARDRGDECGPLAWRHEIAHPLGPPPGRRTSEQLISDAVLTYQVARGDRAGSFHYRLVELDRATMPVDGLAAKLRRYARLFRYSEPPAPGQKPKVIWADRYPVFPVVLLVLAGDSERRLNRRRRTVLALCGEDRELKRTPEVEFSICLLDDLVEHGPFSPIFHTTAKPRALVNWLGEKT